MNEGDEKKTLIGVFASHDSLDKNEAVASIFQHCAEDAGDGRRLSRFRFVFTGGTYRRLFEGNAIRGLESESPRYELSAEARTFLQERCGVIRLPRTERGGITLLANLLTQRKVSVLWPFLTPLTTHLYTPENQALLRLADHWRAKKLMNTGSVMEWIRNEADRDARLNPQPMPLKLELPGSGHEELATAVPGLAGTYALQAKRVDFPDIGEAARCGDWSKVLIALISHDGMKGRMQDFVVDYERELRLFGGILATGTTGGLVEEAAPSLAEERKVHRYHSGPKGGDIEIATEILLGYCHIVFFFVDPLHPHPHTDDIRVVFGACMINDQVRMLSNEMQARAWMDRVVRGS